MQVTVDTAHLVMYKLCGLGSTNSASKALCLSSWLESASCLVNNTSLSPPSTSPIETSLEKFHVQTSALVAGAFVGGLMAGIIFMVIAAFSWSVKQLVYLH